MHTTHTGLFQVRLARCIALVVRIINGRYWPIGVFGIKRQAKECLKMLEGLDHARMIEGRASFRGATNLDLLDTSRMDFTPRQARRMLRDFYLGRYGYRSAEPYDLARLTSIARGKGDPMAKWSDPPLPKDIAFGRGNGGLFIEDWHIPAKWYRRKGDPSRFYYDN